MKIAITSTGNNLDSEVSLVFARSPYFIVADLEDGDIKETSAVENPSKNERGAGISAAQFIANKNVDALISGAVGPNAFNILKQIGIEVYKLQSGTVKENLKLFTENKLDEITSSSSGGPIAGGRGPGRRGGMGGGRQI
ncbi:MAG: NifB/NifX family molybdenum-iron cluster-binding protein [Methanobacteriaceae archaeon]|nr:NifB/NifX family molybdenum-iron cluster-binding protein [Methanobacteriaceae archaeon]OPY25086.1 MAG: Dinitrogenase iron-molybdenum cofactor [Methanobacterium sp. PtaU1.Bin097]